jgi:hypothetical protein
MVETTTGQKLGGIDAYLTVSSGANGAPREYAYLYPPEAERIQFKADYEKVRQIVKRAVNGPDPAEKFFAGLVKSFAGQIVAPAGPGGEIVNAGKNFVQSLPDAIAKANLETANRILEAHKNRASTSFELLMALQNPTPEQVNYFASIDFISETDTNKVEPYQKAEGLVREAVENLVQQSLVPRVERLQGPALFTKGGLKKGTAVFPHDVERAMGLWESEPASPEQEYNLAVAHLQLFAAGWTNNGTFASSDPAEAERMLKHLSDAEDLLLKACSEKYDKPPYHRFIDEVMGFRKVVEKVPKPGAAAPAVAAPAVAAESLPPVKGKYAVLIGIGQFKGDSARPIHSAAHDAGLMKQTLLKAGFPESHIFPLVDENATLFNIKETMDEVSHLLSEDDLFVVFVATHGSAPQSDREGAKEGFIYCYDSNPNSLFASAYSMTDFKYHLDRLIPARRKVVFQDTCHSGSVGDAYQGYSTLRFDEWPAYFGYFAAASRNQSSFGYPDDSYGVFTKILAKRLAQKQGKVRLGELADYLRSAVPPEVSHLFSRDQVPECFFGPGAADILLN